jgi:hypothetical protein
LDGTSDLDSVFMFGVHDDISLNVSTPDDFPLGRFFVGEQDVRAALAAYTDAMHLQAVARVIRAPKGNITWRDGRAPCVMSTGLSADLFFIERFNYRRKRLAYIQIVLDHATLQAGR